MKRDNPNRGTNRLIKRCPWCHHKRKFREPHGNHGGEVKLNRPDWSKIDGRWICGFCSFKRDLVFIYFSGQRNLMSIFTA